MPELNLTPHNYGWSAPLLDGPRFFGHTISVDISTRLVFDGQDEPPPVSVSQAFLVRSLLPHLASIVERVERELAAYEKAYPDFQRVIRNPHVWLSNEDADGISWTFVVESTENPDFGWHAEFNGAEFKELWSGD